MLAFSKRVMEEVMLKVVRWMTIALVVLLVGVPSSNLQASTYYFDDQYFDCALNEVAFCWTNCTGGGFCTGDRHGEFWYHEATRCSDDVTVIQQWYHWSGTAWVPISGPPSPDC